MQDTKTLLNAIAQPRPTGTPGNEEVCAYLERQFGTLGYGVSSLSFPCEVWENGGASCALGMQPVKVGAGPFSPAFQGRAPFVVLHSLEELQSADCTGKIVVLRGSLVAEPLQPKEYPFYYPAHHRAILEALEQSGCVALLAVTGRHPMCGLNPFPLVEDGAFAVPSAYTGAEEWEAAAEQADGQGHMALCIHSSTRCMQSRQLVAGNGQARTRPRVVVCAHMDSHYNTPAALDNAAGVVMMLKTAQHCANAAAGAGAAFVPFNAEEYYGYTAQLAYLEMLEREKAGVGLVVNIDSPGHVGSHISVASYNFTPERDAALEALLEGAGGVQRGEPWYAGDHVPFVQQGVPCLTVASSDFYEGGLAHTHTPRDIPGTVDTAQLDAGAAFLARVLENAENFWQ